MARKKKDTLDDWNKSLGYSDDALKALKSGSYGQLTNRKAQSVRSEDQARIANPTPIPSLAGMKPINDEWQSSFSKARQYQQNVANEEKKFQYNDAIAARNTLDKKDQNYIDGLVSRLGNPDSVRKYLGDKKGAEWEQKYGKTIDQIYDDYVADQDNAKIREGKEHSVRSTLAATLGEFGKPLQAIPHLVSNLIDPDSEIAKGSEKARAEYSDQLKRLKAGVKENLGDTGDKVYDTATQVGGRMLLNSAGSVLGGPLGAGLLTGLADYSDQMDALNLRPDMSGRRKAATALAHGTVEGAGNAITRGILDGLPVVSGVGGKLLNVGKGAGNAAAENAISEAIEMGADTLINGENSEKELNKAIYMMQGMSEAEAEDQVQNDQWNRVLGAAGTGALFGGATKGLGEALDSVKKIPALKGLFDDTKSEAVDTSDINNVIDDATKQAETAKANIQNLADQIPEGRTAADLENSVENAPKVKNKAKAKSPDTFEYVTTDGKYTITPTDNGWEIKGTDGAYSKVNGGFDKAKSQLDNIYKMAGSETIPDVIPQKSSPENPTLTQEVRGLAGDELKAAQDRITSNKSKIKALENEIKIIENDPKNKYRGNLKKSAKADIESRKAQIAELKQDNKVTTRQIKGEPTPVIEQLDADSVARINDFKKEVRKIGNMWGGEGGKQLANDVNAALDRYVESGSHEDFNEFAMDLWQLHTSANGEYSSKSGNVSRYSDYYGDVEDGIFGAALRDNGRDNGLIPNKAIRDFHSGRIDDNNVKVTPAETAPNEPLPVDDSGVVPPNNVPSAPPEGPETDISRRYETLKNSDLFQKSEANMKMLETAKEQGIFNKDIEGRAKAQADALKEFTDDPTKAINDNLNEQWTSGKDLDTSMLVLNDALDSGSQAYANLVMLKQAQQTKQAGRILRAALDYAKRNYAGTKEGTLQEAAKFLNDKAEAVLSSRKTAEQFNAIAERIMKGDLSDLSTRFNMDDVNIQNIKDALEAGAGKADIAHMIAMYQSVGKTGISAEALQKITDIYNQIQAQNLEPNSRARANLEADAFKVLAQDIGGKRTFKEQWDAWRYLAMLGNPKTHLRNLLGNATHYMVTEAKDNIGAVMEAAIDKANKATGGEGIDRTKSVLTSKDRGLVQAGELDADNVAYAALNDSGNKYNVKNEIDRARASFNNKALSKVDELNSNLLDLEDYSALKRKYSKSLARFLKANGADESIFKATDEASKALLDKGRAYAIDQAKQATFHEYSKMAAMLSRTSNELANSDKLRHKAGAWMLEGVLPFKKTPINILKQGGKYSPISIATGLKKAFDAVQTGNSTAAEAIEDLSAGLTGTGIMGLGMFLAHEGFLTGSANPDYTVDQAETEQGAQNYALKIGDNSYTLDWLAPMSLPLFVGAELNRLMNEDDDEGITLNKAISALSTIAEPITEMSMLQGINDVLEKLSYDPAGALAGLATQTGLGYITQGVPTIAGQVARAADDTRRSTYSENTGAEKQLDKALMKVQNKIPFLSRSSQPYVTASGQEQKNEGLASTYLGDNFGTRLIDQMLSPGYFKQGTISETDKELNRLYEATGESPYMNVLSGKVDGQQLGKESFTSYQKLYGSNNDYLYDEIIKSDQYKNLDDAEKVKALKSIRDISKMIADHEIGGKELEKSQQKVYDIYKSKGKEGLLQYFKDKATADSLGMSYDSYIKKEAETPGGATQWMADKDNALNMGFTKKDGTVNMDSYEKAKEIVGDDPNALAAYSDYAKQGFTKNADRLYYLENNPAFTNEQKGQMLTSFKEDGTINGQTAQGAYDLGGFEGMYYYYLLKNNAESNGKSGINKKERAAYFASDAPELDELWNYNQDLYYFLMNNIK